MAGILWRIIIAIIGFAAFVTLLPLVLGVLGIDMSGAILQIIRICAGLLALVYIIWGPTQPWPPRTP